MRKIGTHCTEIDRKTRNRLLRSYRMRKSRKKDGMRGESRMRAIITYITYR